MEHFYKKTIARFLIVAFLFFLIPSDIFNGAENEKKGLKLLKEGEKLFRQYKYSESVEKFREAGPYLKKEKNLSRLYLGLSRSYYAMGLMEQVKEAINKLAVLTVKSSINESEYPRGYLKLYEEILAAAEKRKAENRIVKKEQEPEQLVSVVKTGEETKKISEPEKKPKKKVLTTGVIEKPGVKKKKKKSLILPIVLGAAALGAVAALVGGGKSGGDDTASGQSIVSITSSPSGATIYVDGVSKGVTPGSVFVDPGDHEIRLVIEGWGETTTNRNFDHTLDYSLNAELAPYRYVEEMNYEIDDRINAYNWDMDHSGNFYGIFNDNGYFYLMKHDSNGEIIISKQISQVTGSGTEGTISIFYNNVDDRFYITTMWGTIVRVFNSEGGKIATESANKVHYLSKSTNGDIIVNSGGSTINRLNSDFEYISTLFDNTTQRYYGALKCSDDGDHIFIEKRVDESIIKTDYSMNILTGWAARDGYSCADSYVTSFGTGELEKVFIRASGGSGSRLEIYTGDGKFLTNTDNLGSIGRIAEDNSYNIYAYIGNRIYKYQPGPETEGNGGWTITSTSNSNMHFGTSPSSRSTTSKPRRHSNKKDKSTNKRKKIIK